MANKISVTSLLFVFLLSIPTFSKAEDFVGHRPKVKPVSELDLNRYLGKWYEIAAIPQKFQKGCVATTAEYSLRKDGQIKVNNTCRLNTVDGPVKTAIGRAWIPNHEKPAQLKVSFFWPFAGKYWVIELGQDYEYAVVGHPSRKYLWILSRTPTLETPVLEELLNRIEQKHGYSRESLKFTLQP